MRGRGFEVIEAYKNFGIQLPIRTTHSSAGYDIAVAEEVILNPNEVKRVATGLKAYMLEDEVLKIYIRSSASFKKGLTLANAVGIIDADYYNNSDNEGHIMVLVKKTSEDVLTLKKGDYIAQGIFVKYLLTDGDYGEKPTRSGGFGSSNQ